MLERLSTLFYALLQRGCLLVAITLAAAHGAAAEEGAAEEGDDEAEAAWPIGLYGEVAVVSDYIDRGITSSNHDPALQGWVAGELPVGEGDTALYAGLWGSTVDFDEEGDGPLEIELSLGAYGLVGETGFDWDVWAAYYHYPGARGSLDYDYAEVLGRLGYAFSDALSTSVGYAFSPDYSGSTGLSHYVDGRVAYTLPFDLPAPVTLDATLGRQWFESNSQTWLEDYVDWSIGASVAVGRVAFGVRYTDTDLSENDCYGGSNACDARVVFSVTASF
jgi:uncharacterized protein (TIGR02001 family)